MNPATITVSPGIPGMTNISTVGPCGWVVNFYTFALVVAGLLAFGMAVYGAFKYATSAGNASRQSEGRSIIFNALIGLLLLGGAYLILYTVNPSLTKCSLPTLSGVTIPAGGNVSGGSTGGGTTSQYTGCAGGQCQTLANCTQTTATSGAGAINCGAAAGMINTMNCIQQHDSGLQYKVTEGYPPAVAHMSAGHNNGCAIDVQIQGSNVCSSIAALQAAATACGTSALNEYASCNGTTYITTTGNNVHINAQHGVGGC